MNHHQGSASMARPSTSRPITGSRHPGTPIGPVPGTASRLINTAMQRPASRSGTGQSIALNTQIKIADRPISQQGLATGIKTASKVPNRQIQDKSYYLGLLRSKMSEMANEVVRLNKETDSMIEEHSSFSSHERRAEELANELKNLSAEMADYNLLVDKLNTDTEKDEVEMECKDLKVQNDQEANNIDQLFIERQEKEAKIAQLEKEIEQELHMADNLVEAMTPELRLKYSTLKNTNISLHSEMEKMQQKLDSLQTRKFQLEDELSMSHIKQEALSLHQKLRGLEEKRDELLREENEKGSPAQEREKLLQQVKEDNQEIASIDKQTSEIEEKINKYRDEITSIEQDLDEHHGERNQKYLELKKKEESMDTFLASFEETLKAEVDKITQKEANNVEILERMSRNLIQFQNIPASIDIESLKSDLVFKEGEMEKSKNTVSMLQYELQKLSLDLRKIEELESKIGTETVLMEKKLNSMKDEIVTYSDLDFLKGQSEEKQNMLLDSKEKLQSERKVLQESLDDLEQQYDKIKKELDENETYKQILNLEKRLQHHEQSSFIIKEAIANKAADSDYKRVSGIVFNQIMAYNKLLQDSLSKHTV